MECDACYKIFSNVRALNGHKSVHRVGGRYSEPRKPNPRHLFECLQCKTTVHRGQSRKGKFCSTDCNTEYQWHQVTVPAILRGEVNPASNTFTGSRVRRFLEERDGPGCTNCKNTEWMGEPLIFDIDHVDGCNTNHMPSNLRLLCPNCHRQTLTWGNKKRLYN